MTNIHTDILKYFDVQLKEYGTKRDVELLYYVHLHKRGDEDSCTYILKSATIKEMEKLIEFLDFDRFNGLKTPIFYYVRDREINLQKFIYGLGEYIGCTRFKYYR